MKWWVLGTVVLGVFIAIMLMRGLTANSAIKTAEEASPAPMLSSPKSPITENPKSAIELVLEQREKEKEASAWGIGFTSSTPTHGADLLKRAKANPALAEALLRVKKEVDVIIYGSDHFSVDHTWWIKVDTRASDQEIIEFLVGKQE